MNISLGIVGLPNVGKSTLFNALTKKSVPAENYPFCTIDPNVGIVPVADPRLDKIAQLVQPQATIPAVVEFFDIAGLVRGANKGEGLGNQFLSHIREVSAIVHVVRKFNSSDILHVETTVDPLRDIEIIHTELILKDISTVETRLASLIRNVKGDKKLQPAIDHLQGLLAHLNDGNLGNKFPLDSAVAEIIQTRRELFLLSDKLELYVVNVEPEAAHTAISELRAVLGDDIEILAMDIKLESELMAMPLEERQEFMESYNLEFSGLELLTRSAYKLLGLISYFTAGEKEVRAWTIEQGMTAPKAAGVIHTDFEKHMIAADVVGYEDFVGVGGWEAAKQQGKIHLEGKTYIVRDGDVMLFKVNK